MLLHGVRIVILGCTIYYALAGALLVAGGVLAWQRRRSLWALLAIALLAAKLVGRGHIEQVVMAAKGVISVIPASDLAVSGNGRILAEGEGSVMQSSPEETPAE